MGYKLILHKQVEKKIISFPSEIKIRIQEAFLKILENPFYNQAHIKKLSGKKDQYRYKLGDYRIVYHAELNNPEISILVIATRENSYK